MGVGGLEDLGELLVQLFYEDNDAPTDDIWLVRELQGLGQSVSAGQNVRVSVGQETLEQTNKALMWIFTGQ